MPKFEAGANRKAEANVWGQEGEYAETARETDLTNFKIANVPAANDTERPRDVAPRAVTRESIAEDPAVLAKLLGDADFGLSQNEQSFQSDPADSNLTAPTSEQLSTVEDIYVSNRPENLSRVEPTEGSLPEKPTDFGDVPVKITEVEARYKHDNEARIAPTPQAKAPVQSATQYFGTTPSWTKASSLTERPPLKKKPFYKRWLGL